MSYETKKTALMFRVWAPPVEARFSLKEAQEQSPGCYACDGVVLIPLWKGEGLEEHVQRAVSYGPDGTPLTDAEVFRVWTLLTTDLATRPGLNPMMRNLCRAVDGLVQTSLARVPAELEPRKNTP